MRGHDSVSDTHTESRSIHPLIRVRPSVITVKEAGLCLRVHAYTVITDGDEGNLSFMHNAQYDFRPRRVMLDSVGN
ncbi:hypothetical protein D1872_268390 [compost metagenome]